MTINRIPTDMIIDRASGQKLSEQLSDIATQLDPRQSGETDDTARIQRAVTKAKANGFNRVLLKPGSYEISSSIYCSTEGDALAVTIEGVNAESVEIVVNVTGTTPAFVFEKVAHNVEGWNERWSNGGLKNLRIRPKTINYTGTAIYIRGAVFAQFENIRISSMNYGIWLHNQGAGIYSEANMFKNCRIDFCNNGIRLEQGTGDQSFHGNNFDNVFMNVKPNQTGFNMVSGLLYNARLNLFMWAQKNSDNSFPTGNARPVYVNCNGTVKTTTGTITVESYAEGRLTGTGSFVLTGQMRGIGGTGQPLIFVDDTLVKGDGSRVFMCNNQFIHNERRSITANAGVTQTITIGKGISDPNQPYLGYLRVYGGTVDIRRVFLLNAKGDGTNGYYVQLAEFVNTATATSKITSHWVDLNGKLGTNIQTDIDLTFEFRAESLGTSLTNW